MSLKTIPDVFISMLFICTIFGVSCRKADLITTVSDFKAGFLNPPDSVRPGVYWYFMDGNLSREEMTNDLESMKEAGIGNLIFLEVNVGVPRGKVDFLSDQWQELFKHAVNEAERLGIQITLGSGPGWAGSGGPWVKLPQSMQHLVASSVNAKGPSRFKAMLPKPEPRKPYFGEEGFTEPLRMQWEEYYEDVAVLAFPTPLNKEMIEYVDEKALYYRAPYSSAPGVRPYLITSANYPVQDPGSVIQQGEIIDITKYLQPDGCLTWEVPAGNWTIMRFGRRNNGAVTRPAPLPGLGFECDKFDTVAFDAHCNAYIGKLIRKVGKPKNNSTGGWKFLHIDSWEMGAQNWTENFRQEFIQRRGYDPLLYLPAFTGRIVGSLEISERFLWDLRQTSQELIIENHAGRFKEFGRKNRLRLSIEPYDMNPTADLDLGAVADVPMCEFWSKGYGFNTSFSCIEATSIAHILGRPVVAAEAFTAVDYEAWKLFPGAIKNQGDWAFCTGINRFVYHTFAHKPFGVKYLPGMTMGPYGVHWDRGQTWWPMVSAYHRYISRCQYLLQQGYTVADILYLTPEGAPHVFRPPSSALKGNDTIPDRRGYNFDGCSPNILISGASVRNHQITFPGGASYRLLVLPSVETMTPELLAEIEKLITDGAIVIGNPPFKSPSLVNYPECDRVVRSIAEKLWGNFNSPTSVTERNFGKGKIYWGGNLSHLDPTELYPNYEATAALLEQMNVVEDFESSGSVRYTHRKTADIDIYFVANKTNQTVKANCLFGIDKGTPELWDPLTGETRGLPEFTRQQGCTILDLQFEAYQSYFIVFNNVGSASSKKVSGVKNFPEMASVAEIEGPWDISFDPKWGGPEKVTFEKLIDWTKRPEEGIEYYSGIAVYNKIFDLPKDNYAKEYDELYLDLGEVNNIASVRLNGKDIGIVWTAPWRVDITSTVKQKGNHLEINVANLWPNRLIGDERFTDDGIKEGKWPEWLLKGKPRTSGRYTFTTHRYYKKNDPLLKSGLIGPVRIIGVFRKSDN